MYYTIKDFSGFGKLFFLGDLDGLQKVSYISNLNDIIIEEDWNESSDFFEEIIFKLEKYFKGNEVDFLFELNFSGTHFQRAVWRELMKVPYGETITYGEIAMNLDNPSAVRAVGNAVSQNPFLIIVPCHRVISGDGSIGGFSCGIDKKKILHKIEGIKVKK